ncbi:hypothetical protein RZS08_50565, partial [Arthrospira platensis SPKY1]|nr:hypothetical protein [Arthrospira platensis SPKY1]
VSQISLNQMEKVEVIKGPHALRFGTGLGGTLLFSSLPPEFGDKLAPAGRLSTSYESNGGIFRTEGLLGLRSRSLALDLNGAWSQGGDYTAGDGAVVPSSFNRGSFGGNLHLKASEQHQFSLNLTRNLA